MSDKPFWTQEQVALIRTQLFPALTDDEFRLLEQTCRRTGIDVFSRQVFAVHRKEKKTGIYKMSIQFSIDGYRSLADRTGQYMGSKGFWCGKDGVWKDVWLDGLPSAAKVVVYKGSSTIGFEGVARFEAYAQKDYGGNLQPMWKKMPDVMIAKCAEALALRKAFPSQLSGFYTEDEMAQADQPDFDKKEEPTLNTLCHQLAAKLGSKEPVYQAIQDATGHPTGKPGDLDESQQISAIAKIKQLLN